MSNALAIATVTTALAQIVRTAAQSMVAGSDVVTGPPDPSGSPANRIHLFLYQVSPNGAMRNNDLPMRSADGKLVMRPTAAINLHYLLAFYGSGSDLETQRMLGAVVRDLHAKPLLTRTVIQDAISSQTFLTDSNLADAVEQVKFSPLAVSLEEMAKLWSVFFQTPYALSLAYEAAVVLIESELQTQPALPVLKRGDTDQGVDTLLGPFAVLEKAYFGMDQDPILKPRPISLPPARLGLAVILGGRNLSGEGGLLRFRHSRLDVSQELSPEPADVSAKELKIRLPHPDSETSQTDWAPGVYTVTVVQNRPGTDRECTSNALPIPLSPIITAIEPGTTIARDDDGAATLTITCRPRVRAEQRTVLLVAGREITGTIDDDDPDKIVFVMEDAEAVTDAIIRLRVDGIESMPFSREDAPPPPHFVFDPNQRVSIT